MKTISIGKKKIGIGENTFIVTEMSANHLMDYHRAKAIIDAAKFSGADAIKLQTYTADTMTLKIKKEEFMASKGSPWEGMYLYDLYKEASTPWEWQKDLFEYAQEQGLICFSSPFDKTAVDFMMKIGMPAIKIASFEITDIPLIKYAASMGKPMILSTGIAKLEEISEAVSVCREVGNEQIILLKCTTSYPALYEDMNLSVINNLAETFDVVSGISDHTMGSEVAIASVAIGASMIEKHLTLSRDDGGPDASFSMEPQELKDLVMQVRRTEKAMGKVTYQLTERQKESRKRARSLYIVKDIKAGEIFTEENVRSIRPGYGLAPKYLEDILGRTARENLSAGTPLLWEYVGNKQCHNAGKG